MKQIVSLFSWKSDKKAVYLPPQLYEAYEKYTKVLPVCIAGVSLVMREKQVYRYTG